jgi:Domain of unknown function (DUF4262)
MTIRIGSDDAERKVLADVKKFGWHCLNIFEEDGKPPWTFSIGFHKTWNFPELIVIGLKREVAHSTLNIVATQLAEGTRLDLALASDELFNDFACCFVEVPTPMYREYVGTARWFYGGDAFPLYQIIWLSGDGYSLGMSLRARATSNGNPCWVARNQPLVCDCGGSMTDG